MNIHAVKGLEPSIPTSRGPQTNASDRTTTVIWIVHRHIISKFLLVSLCTEEGFTSVLFISCHPGGREV
jgi:hypothetical protein